LAVRPGGAQDRGAVHRPVHALLFVLSVVSDSDRVALRGHYRRALAVPQIRHLGHLDSRDDPGPGHGPGYGHPGAVGAHGRLRDRRRHGGCQRGVVWSIGGRHPRHGRRLGSQGVYRRRRRAHGEPRRLDRRRRLHQPLGGLCLALGEPGSGGHRFVCRTDPDPAVSAHGALCADTEMSRRRTTVYWTGFCVVLGLLIIAPLVLPEFWRRFLTEILIWGLLAMSSGHWSVLGLGIYGAAAALLSVSPPSLLLALLCGLVTAAAAAAFVAYFSTRLRDIYFAITTLIFSQIFYVIIFTWTEVTGGENGTFSRPPLAIPG